MKILKLLSITLLAVILNSSFQDSSVIIKGKFIGELIPETIDYTIPYNGSTFWGFKETIPIDSMGNFEFSVEVPATTFISIQHESTRKYIIIEPKIKSYNIVFDSTNKENELIVNSKNKEGQKIIGKFNYSPPTSLKVIRSFENDLESIDEMIIKINEAKQKELKPLQELFEQNKISLDFYNTAKTDRECYYSIVQSEISANQLIKGKEKERAIQSWEASFKAMSNEEETFLSSTYFNIYLKKYLEFMSIKSLEFNIDEYIKKIKPLYKNGEYHTFMVNEGENILKGEDILEFFTASYIYYSAYQNKYEKELISLFRQFKKDFPQSSYVKYISPLIENIAEYHSQVDDSLAEGFNIIENGKEFNSLNEIVKSLDKKAIYVDVWATWCGPCKKEFEYKKELDDLLKNNDVQMLYISIDDDNSILDWKKTIIFYELFGNHLKANKNLRKDLEQILSKEDTAITIPWYILINKNGNIVKKFAKRPSQIKDLEKEIKELIKN